MKIKVICKIEIFYFFLFYLVSQSQDRKSVV